MERLLALMNDLMFVVKVQAVAKQAGVVPSFVRDSENFHTQLALGPFAVIFDLTFQEVDPISLIALLKNNPSTAGVWTLGFFPHVNVDLKRRAEEAGCDLVIARSVFAERLPGLLRERLLSTAEFPE